MGDGYRYWKGPDGSLQMGTEEDYADIMDLQGVSNTPSVSTATGGMTGVGDLLGTTNNTSMFGGTMDWLNQNKAGIGAGLGLAQLGLGAYSTFFGQGKDRFDKQMQLMDQQIASNKDKLERRDALNKAWAQYGQGLAGSTTKGQ